MEQSQEKNYQPGGHAEQLRTQLWGRRAPSTASLRSLDGLLLPTADFDANYAEQQKEIEIESRAPESSSTVFSDSARSSGKALVLHQPATHLTMVDDETSRRPSGSHTPTFRWSMSLDVPRRSKTKPKKLEEKGVDSLTKGEVRTDPVVGLQQRETEDDQWRKAVYHESIRAELYARAGPVAQYVEQRKSGLGVHNKTAFCEVQRTWSLHRSKWSQIKDNILNRFERKGYAAEQLLHPGLMMWGDRVVIDNDNHIVIDYDIPVTLSSEYEGQFMEACRRLIPGLQTRDFWARMPKYSTPPDSTGHGGILTKLGRLGNRQSRFRTQNGLLSWQSRYGTSAMKDAILSQLSKEQKANNSTEGFAGLSRNQLKAVLAKSKGSASSISKRRYHDERKRRAREGAGATEEESEEEETD